MKVTFHISLPLHLHPQLRAVAGELDLAVVVGIRITVGNPEQSIKSVTAHDGDDNLPVTQEVCNSNASMADSTAILNPQMTMIWMKAEIIHPELIWLFII
jgi:hypothetical protein